MSYVNTPKIKLSTQTKKVPLNHTLKQDQVILLFKMLKQEYKSRELGRDLSKDSKSTALKQGSACQTTK